jgi:hypothetical protein
VSANKAARPDPDPDAPRPCQAAREEVTAALAELARLHAKLPMPQAIFAARIQGIVDEHAEPCGCELLVQHNADGLVALRIKVPKSEFHCELCNTIECFFHPHTAELKAATRKAR